MSHTPEQALSLWCPMVRHEGNVGGSFSRGTLNSNPTNADTPVDEVTAPVPEQKQLIISLVENGSMTDKQIASEVGCSTLVVREVYKAHLEAKHA